MDAKEESAGAWQKFAVAATRYSYLMISAIDHRPLTLAYFCMRDSIAPTVHKKPPTSLSYPAPKLTLF
jgi:hypothetical protein